MTNTTPSGSLGSGAPAGSVRDSAEIGGASEPSELVLINSVERSALGCTGQTYGAFKLISDERSRQDAKWGVAVDRKLHIYDWLAILGEEVGELIKTCRTDNPEPEHSPDARLKEAMQVAAVATAILEVVMANGA